MYPHEWVTRSMAYKQGKAPTYQKFSDGNREEGDYMKQFDVQAWKRIIWSYLARFNPLKNLERKVI